MSNTNDFPLGRPMSEPSNRLVTEQEVAKLIRDLAQQIKDLDKRLKRLEQRPVYR